MFDILYNLLIIKIFILVNCFVTSDSTWAIEDDENNSITSRESEGPVWTIEDDTDKCTTPTGEKGTCVIQTSCKPIMDLYDKSFEVPEHVRHSFLQKYLCGSQDNLMKICCPPDSINLKSLLLPKLTEIPTTKNPNQGKLTQVNKIKNDCQTPDGLNGTCISIYKCDKIFSALNPKLTTKQIQWLRAHACGDPNNIYLICCPLPVTKNPIRKKPLVKKPILKTSSTNKTTNGCQTPDGLEGTCMSIYYCDTIFSALNPKLTTKQIQRLRAHACGDPNNIYQVCCPPPPNVDEHPNRPLLPNNCGVPEDTSRIKNGQSAGLFQYPWMVLLSYRVANQNFQCGGTIINDKYILTAAHCVVNTAHPLAGVRIGEYNLNSTQDCIEYDNGKDCADPPQDIPIEEIIPHPNYDTTNYKNDIALLRVPQINITKRTTRPICLPLNAARVESFVKRSLIITGWGITENYTASPELLKATVPFVKQEKCIDAYAKLTNITNLQFCAGGGSSESCKGDSGGPLQVYMPLHNAGRYCQQGIASFGHIHCGIASFPSVYTRITYYMDWILDTIRP